MTPYQQAFIRNEITRDQNDRAARSLGGVAFSVTSEARWDSSLQGTTTEKMHSCHQQTLHVSLSVCVWSVDVKCIFESRLMTELRCCFDGNFSSFCHNNSIPTQPGLTSVFPQPRTGTHTPHAPHTPPILHSLVLVLLPLMRRRPLCQNLSSPSQRM